MPMYLSALLSGTAEPLLPHFVLLSVSIVAAFAVGAGIIFESPKYSESIHRVAMCLVLGGIAVESVCTFFLFVFDEGISNAQQSKIIALETRIAQRELSSNTIAKFRTAIASVPDSIPNKVVFSYLMGDQESAYFAYEIGRYFIAARWNIDIEVRSYPIMLVWGIKIFGPDNPTTRAVWGIFDAANIQFSKDEMPGGFMSYGHQPVPGETVIFIAPKEPAISEAEAGRAGAK